MKIKTTYSFEKLKKSLDLVIENALKESGDKYKTSMEKILDDGKRLEPLSQIRIDNRKAGYGWMGKPVPPTADTRPLIQTGKLRNSMRVSKEGVYMEDYGIEHDRATFKDSKIQVDERPFIRMSLDETKLTDVAKKYYNKLKKAFKK